MQYERANKQLFLTQGGFDVIANIIDHLIEKKDLFSDSKADLLGWALRILASAVVSMMMNIILIIP